MVVQPEAWTAVGVSAAAGFAAVGTTAAAYFASRSQQRKTQDTVGLVQTKVETVNRKVESAAATAEEAKGVAAVAARNTQAVSNGFASRTTDGIEGVRALLEDVRDRTTQLLEVSGRTVARLDQVIARQDRTDDRFTEHLLSHLEERKGTTTAGGGTT